MVARDRLAFLLLNLGWGASLGIAAALLAHTAGAWTGEPSGALLAAGSVAVFGLAYVVTVALRGEWPTLRGAVTVAASGVALFCAWSLAVSAPSWVLAWAGAAALGVLAGIARPLPARAAR
jgi:hypothetical protein